MAKGNRKDPSDIDSNSIEIINNSIEKPIETNGWEELLMANIFQNGLFGIHSYLFYSM